MDAQNVPTHRIKRRRHPMAAATTMALVVFFSVLIGATPAHADSSACGSASGVGYVCTYVNGSGTWINHIWANRSKTTPPEICRSSAWAYYIPPWGGAYGLGYTERADCVYFTARLHGRQPVCAIRLASVHQVHGVWSTRGCGTLRGGEVEVSQSPVRPCAK